MKKKNNDSTDEYYKFLYDKDGIIYRLNNMIAYEENVNYLDDNISTIEFNIDCNTDYKTDNHKSNKKYLKHKIDFNPYKSPVLQYTPDDNDDITTDSVEWWSDKNDDFDANDYIK